MSIEKQRSPAGARSRRLANPIESSSITCSGVESSPIVSHLVKNKRWPKISYFFQGKWPRGDIITWACAVDNQLVTKELAAGTEKKPTSGSFLRMVLCTLRDLGRRGW